MVWLWVERRDEVDSSLGRSDVGRRGCVNRGKACWYDLQSSTTLEVLSSTALSFSGVVNIYKRESTTLTNVCHFL